MLNDLLKYKMKGNGAIIVHNNRFLFTVGNEKYWDKSRDPWIITFTNTGGHVEPNEDIIEATKREALEELGSEIELFSSEITVYAALENSKLFFYDIDEEISPLIIYNSAKMKMSVCVYLARIKTDPSPLREVPALILLPPSSINGGSLFSLLASEAILMEQKEGIIPRNSILIPFGSARIIAENWSSFYAIRSFKKFIETEFNYESS